MFKLPFGRKRAESFGLDIGSSAIKVVQLHEAGNGYSVSALGVVPLRPDIIADGTIKDPPAVVYRYSPDRKGEHPRSHLAGFRGFLQADGYSGFGPLYKVADGEDAVVTEIADSVEDEELRRGFLARSDVRNLA